MQTLGLSDSTPATDNRLKSLLWPSVNTGSDVDYLGTQGYWICTVLAVVSGAFWSIAGHPFTGLIIFIFYYFSGVGVRERSRYAALVVAILYCVDTLLLGLSVVRVIFCALLLANVRATWIASTWAPASEEAAIPPRLNETLGDKLADQLPMWLWPRIQILYYIYSGGFIALSVYGWSKLPTFR